MRRHVGRSRSDTVGRVAGGLRDSSLTRVRPFFGELIARDPNGGSWLGDLLSATPHGKAVFAGLLSEPGALDASLAAARPNGLLGCFEFGVPAPKDLLAWYIEHPDDLNWPKNRTYSENATQMRRALLYDLPPGE